jgi:hypothetical protein
MKYILPLTFFYCIVLTAHCQDKRYKTAIIALYNLENFYDTIHNPQINDTDFLPTGSKHYTSSVYLNKTEHLATVISQIGTDLNADGPALLGVAEIENDTVLNDLINEPILIKRHFRFIHYDSPDPRGIDVALIYNPKYFKVDTSYKLRVKLQSGKYFYFTRDILYVKGELDGETIHVLVNHWPSRLGGEQKSEASREEAAAIAKKQIDLILKKDSTAKIIMMGDLNDDPVNASVAKVLGADGNLQNIKQNSLYNPFVDLYKKGIGSIAFGDAWGLFDQIILSYAWLNKNQNGFFFYQPHIFNKDFMIENTGAYKGYPMRTWDGNNYRGGYSDHFPTYIILLKKVRN